MDNLSGQSIKGYELHDLIGAGGFGAVYRAYQPLIKRDVAMKIILPEYANHPEFIRRFEFEAQLIARLEHIHIVPLYDYWREPNGAFLVMRWLRGGSLRSALREGPLDTVTAVRVTEQISAALATAHRRGVVHRDIKPDNILFDEDGNAYLADFGIAKDLREAKLDGESTSSFDEGALTGSPFYLSPEQAQSLPITPQTDLYSLGIVLYEMLVGQPPFYSEEGLIAILLQHINDPVPSVRIHRPDLPQAVDAVIQRATAKEPSGRYSDALSLAVEFHRALIGSGGEVIATARPREIVPGMDEVLIITKPITASTLIIVPSAEVTNPYKGLRPFEEADASDFFGRALLIEKLIDRFKEPGDISRFLAVIGPSGSGKSSVVKAGLIPALRKGALPNSKGWYMAQMVPGPDPFRELATALLGFAVNPPANLLELLRTDQLALAEAVEFILPPGDENCLLLTIDQFEEVFTLVEDEAARSHFLDLLLMAIAQEGCRFRLIITLRADFYDRPLLYPGFGEMVRRRNEVVLPLATDEMREAIVAPAERAGVTVETGLVAAIVAEISEQPGALPLLQYALTEVFERRQGNVLTLEAYHASGGVLGALARRAEELYQETDEVGQAAVRQIFIRLVNVGEGSENTRRRAMLHELLLLAENENVAHRVIDALGKYRLLTFDHDPDTRAPNVAVAHEALIREWKRLRDWLDESREDILLQRRLATANEEWQRQHRDASFLATGVRLQQFESLVQRATIALTPQEVDYVKASVVHREAREAAERARVEREAALEKRSRDRMRALAIVMAVAAALTSVLAVFAYSSFQNAEKERKNAEDQRQIAVEQRGIAERNAEVSDSLALVASAQTQLVRKNRDLAIGLALVANQITDPPVESQLMLAQAALSAGTHRVFVGHEGPVFGVAYSPDGKTAISGAFDWNLILWDVETGEIIRKFEGHENFIRGVAFSPDGKTVLSGGMDNLMILWDVETGEIIHKFEGHEKPVRAVVYSPDGKIGVSAADDYSLISWNLETGEMIHKFEGHTERVRGAAISPDGKWLASASYDATLILWDLETGELIRTFVGHEDKATTVVFNADGTRLLSGAADRTIRLWDVETGEELLRMQGHGTWVKSVTFSPDGRTVLSASDDGSVRLWNSVTGDEIDRFIDHTSFVEQAVFSPDGNHILSASGDGTVRLWDITNGAEIRRFVGSSDGVLSVAVSPDGKTALTGGYDSLVRIWNVETGEQTGQFDGHLDRGFVSPLVFSPDGKTVVSSDSFGTDAEIPDDDVILLWDVTTGEVIQQFVGHNDWVNTAAFSPDGQLLATGSKDKLIKIWDVQTGELIRTLEGYESFINSVVFSSDGKYLLSGAELPDNRIILWNTETWEQERVLPGHDGHVNSVAFSPDNQKIVSGGADNLVIVWDAASGKIIYRLQGHTAPVSRALFNADGTLIASASWDGTIRLWDVATGQQIRQLDNGQAVWAIDYTPDGLAVLTGSEDTTVRLWDATPLGLDRLLAWTNANRYVYTDFTCLQRSQFHIDPQCDAEGNLPASTAP
ncbi:MAG: protein kinase [Chloroflexi bacterium]|nr:protein kinase [Chloroflexota bacterium]